MPALVFDDQQIEFVIDRVVDRTFRMDFSWDWPGGVAFTEYAKPIRPPANRSIWNS